MCILDLQQSVRSTQPQVIANITISDSPILSAAAIPTKFGSNSMRPGARAEETERKTEAAMETLQLGPTISITSVTSSESRVSSNSNGSHDSHVAISRDSSISSMDDAITILKTESQRGLESGTGTTSLQNGHASNDEGSSQRGPDVVEESLNAMARQKLHPCRESTPTAKTGFHRVRSNSAPSFPDPQTIAHGIAKKNTSLVLDTSVGQAPKRSESVSRLWSPLSLVQSNLAVEGGGQDHCMWLGTEAGQLLIYSAGSNLRSRSSRESVKLPAPIHCIR